MCAAPRKLVVALLVSVLIAATPPISEAKRALGGSNRKTSSGGSHTTRHQTSVTKPTYNTNSGSSNSHADAAKLSYPNYNSQPNRPANAPTSNNQEIGWKAPNQGNAGPPPAYSASNVAGGAHTNMHEPPPAYQKPNYGAAPPSYNQATGTNYGAQPQYPHTAGIPAGATYHSPNNLPPGATYYQNPSQVPGGYSPVGGYPGGYHSPGAMPGGASYYNSPQSIPQGATYLPAGNALPPGAVLVSSPPQQTSSGLGFGSGLAAGAIGGAILGHVLTPTQTRVVEQAPAAGGGSSDGGHDRIIIINNGQPVNATDANGATIINNGVTQAPAAVAAGETPAPLAPMAPVPVATPDMSQNTNNPPPAPLAPFPDANGSPAPALKTYCTNVRVNETDPNDTTKMIEVDKIACYEVREDSNKPADPAPANPAEGSPPLAPMPPITPGASSQQLQQQSTMIGDQTIKSANNAPRAKENSIFAFLLFFIVSRLAAYN